MEVVAVDVSDEPRVGSVLAAAFAKDPLFAHVEPDPLTRASFLAPFMEALTRRSHRFAVALRTAPELWGASLWKSPELGELDAEQLRLSGLDRIGEWLSPSAWARFENVFGPVEEALARDVPGRRWYLGVLGVAPGHQGRGIGSRLMEPILRRADAEGLPVTLETANAINLPLYRRHGFEVLRELPASLTGGVVVWTMKRDPTPNA